MSQMDKVAAAIADPIRRELLEAIAVRSQTVNELAARVPVSRPAVSRHLRVLRVSGLVVDQEIGRNRVYSLQPGAFSELKAWMDQITQSSGWSPNLDALAKEVSRSARDRRNEQQSKENTA